MEHDTAQHTEYGAGDLNRGASPTITRVKAEPPARKRLNAADIEVAASKSAPPTEDVSIEEWGGDVTIQGLTAAARDKFEASFRRRRKGGRIDVVTDNMRAMLVVKCAVDEKGNPIWAASDATWVGQQPASIVNKLYEVAARLSGMTPADTDELEGN